MQFLLLIGIPIILIVYGIPVHIINMSKIINKLSIIIIDKSKTKIVTTVTSNGNSIVHNRINRYEAYNSTSSRLKIHILDLYCLNQNFSIKLKILDFSGYF